MAPQKEASGAQRSLKNLTAHCTVKTIAKHGPGRLSLSQLLSLELNPNCLVSPFGDLAQRKVDYRRTNEDKNLKK